MINCPHIAIARDLYQAAADALRPFPRMLPSEFAPKYRVLKEGTTERPGRWSNEVFPYLIDIMDAVAEAIRTGKRGIVLMKSGQGGGSEAMINALCYLLTYFPGPALYLISKDDLAKEFSRERFGHIIDTCEPLARKAVRGKGSGELIQVKRFIDGKLAILGGRSVLNLQSLPYRIVVIDEFDSLLDEIDGHGDPLKLAEIRTDSFSGQTLIIAFAHPSTRNRGAGLLYYDNSDQRRGMVVCPHCSTEFYLNWERDVRAVPMAGMSDAQAKYDARCYRYFAPCCAAEITDAQRFSIVRNTRQRSTLPAAIAADKRWIGVHFSQLYMSNKPLRFLAEEWVDCLRKGDAVKRVFFNKRLGDVYDAAVKETSADAWREVICKRRSADDLEWYELGQVPRGVRFITAGQDSRSTELHWAVWGWGLLPDEGNNLTLCGWLIDAGVQERPYSLVLQSAELKVFDQLLYDRFFPSTDTKYQFDVLQGLHDTGWQPIAAYDYCRQKPFRAFPSKGGSEESGSNAPAVRWGSTPVFRVGDEEIKDPSLKLCVLNTFALKETFFGLAKASFKRAARPGFPVELKTVFTMPHNIDQLRDKQGLTFVDHLANEYLTVEKKKHIWKKKGPQHWLDCSIYAYAAAINCNPFQQGLPFEDAEKKVIQEREQVELSKLKARSTAQQDSWIATDRRSEGGDWIRER